MMVEMKEHLRTVLGEAIKMGIEINEIGVLVTVTKMID